MKFCTVPHPYLIDVEAFLSPLLLVPPACPCVYVELIVHENLEVVSVGEALARADGGQQQQGLPLQILDEQISEPIFRLEMLVANKTTDETIASPACCLRQPAHTLVVVDLLRYL